MHPQIDAPHVSDPQLSMETVLNSTEATQKMPHTNRYESENAN